MLLSAMQIVSVIITLLGVASFSIVFTVLYSSYVHSSIKEIQSGKKDIALIDEYLKSQQPKEKKKKKAISIVKSVFFYLALVIIVPLFIASIVHRIQGNTLMIHNSGIMVVTSGSMSEKNSANDYLITNHLDNQFKTYDIIVLEKVKKPEQLKLYDVIAYRNNKGVNIIHRIVEIHENGSFTTRGDANSESDLYHPTINDVIGKYSNKKIPFIGMFVLFFQSYPGIITIVALIYCLIMFDRYSTKYINAQEKRLQFLQEIIDYTKDLGKVELNSDFIETIYYQGYAYQFNDKGLIQKTKMDDNNPETNKAIKVIKNGNITETTEILTDTTNEEGNKKHE